MTEISFLFKTINYDKNIIFCNIRVFVREHSWGQPTKLTNHSGLAIGALKMIIVGFGKRLTESVFVVCRQMSYERKGCYWWIGGEGMTCTRLVTLLLLSSTASCVMVVVEFKSVILVLSGVWKKQRDTARKRIYLFFICLWELACMRAD